MNRGWTMLTGLLLAVGLVALTVAPAVAAHQHVEIEQYAYGPSSLNVTQGDTVTWTNLDTAPHDVVVTSGPSKFRSPLLDKGQSWSHTFTEGGSYSYICSVHPDMHGVVTARPTPPPAPEPAQTPAQEPAPTPTSVLSQGAQPTSKPSATRPAKRQHTRTREVAPVATSATPVAATESASLDPLVLVLGASTAVVVFCLLLMASRPPARPTE